MKPTLIAPAIILFGITAAMAQVSAPTQQEAKAKADCDDAIPKIEDLIGSADENCIDTESAKNFLSTAKSAQGSGDGSSCVQALILAQNRVAVEAPAQDTNSPKAD